MRRSVWSIALWFLWDFSGLRAIWTKILPEPNAAPAKRPPSTFLLWSLGIYVASFGIASQIYQYQHGQLQAEVTQFASKLTDQNAATLMARVAALQQRQVVVAPAFWEPLRTLRSLTGEVSCDAHIVDQLKRLVEVYRLHLNSSNLENCDLGEAKLTGANLHPSNLDLANLSRAELFGADMVQSSLMGADISYAVLDGAQLEDAVVGGFMWNAPAMTTLCGASLRFAKLMRADLSGVDLSHTDLRGADLTNADLSPDPRGKVTFDDGSSEELHDPPTLLVGAYLDGAILDGADLSNVVWIDGTTCASGSVGKCIDGNGNAAPIPPGPGGISTGARVEAKCMGRRVARSVDPRGDQGFVLSLPPGVHSPRFAAD